MSAAPSLRLRDLRWRTYDTLRVHGGVTVLRQIAHDVETDTYWVRMGGPIRQLLAVDGIRLLAQAQHFREDRQ